MKDFPIAVISAENLDDLVSVLGGVKISSFEDEHEIFLSRDLFSRIGKHDSDENVVYIELGAARLALEPKEEGITLWVKEVPVLERGLVLRT